MASVVAYERISERTAGEWVKVKTLKEGGKFLEGFLLTKEEIHFYENLFENIFPVYRKMNPGSSLFTYLKVRVNEDGEKYVPHPCEITDLTFSNGESWSSFCKSTFSDSYFPMDAFFDLRSDREYSLSSEKGRNGGRLIVYLIKLLKQYFPESVSLERVTNGRGFDLRDTLSPSIQKVKEHIEASEEMIEGYFKKLKISSFDSNSRKTLKEKAIIVRKGEDTIVREEMLADVAFSKNIFSRGVFILSEESISSLLGSLANLVKKEFKKISDSLREHGEKKDDSYRRNFYGKSGLIHPCSFDFDNEVNILCTTTEAGRTDLVARERRKKGLSAFYLLTLINFGSHYSPNGKGIYSKEDTRTVINDTIAFYETLTGVVKNHFNNHDYRSFFQGKEIHSPWNILDKIRINPSSFRDIVTFVLKESYMEKINSFLCKGRLGSSLSSEEEKKGCVAERFRDEIGVNLFGRSLFPGEEASLKSFDEVTTGVPKGITDEYKKLAQALRKSGQKRPRTVGFSTRMRKIAKIIPYYGSSNDGSFWTGIIHPCGFIYDDKMKISCENYETWLHRGGINNSHVESLRDSRDVFYVITLGKIGSILKGETSYTGPEVRKTISSVLSFLRRIISKGRSEGKDPFEISLQNEIDSKKIECSERTACNPVLFSKEFEDQKIENQVFRYVADKVISGKVDGAFYDLLAFAYKRVKYVSMNNLEKLIGRDLVTSYGKIVEDLRKYGMKNKAGTNLAVKYFYGPGQGEKEKDYLIHPCDFIYSDQKEIDCQELGLRRELLIENGRTAFFAIALGEAGNIERDFSSRMNMEKVVSSVNYLIEKLAIEVAGEKKVDKFEEEIKGRIKKGGQELSSARNKVFKYFQDASSVEEKVKRFHDFLTLVYKKVKYLSSNEISSYLGDNSSLVESYKKMALALKKHGGKKNNKSLERRYYYGSTKGNFSPNYFISSCDFILDSTVKIDCSRLLLSMPEMVIEVDEQEKEKYFARLLAQYGARQLKISRLERHDRNTLLNVILAVKLHLSKTMIMLKANKHFLDEHIKELSRRWYEDRIFTDEDKKKVSEYILTEVNKSLGNEPASLMGVVLLNEKDIFSGVLSRTSDSEYIIADKIYRDYKRLSSALREYGGMREVSSFSSIHSKNFYGTSGVIHPCSFVYNNTHRISCARYLGKEDKDAQRDFLLIALSKYGTELAKGGSYNKLMLQVAPSSVQHFLETAVENLKNLQQKDSTGRDVFEEFVLTDGRLAESRGKERELIYKYGSDLSNSAANFLDILSLAFKKTRYVKIDYFKKNNGLFLSDSLIRNYRKLSDALIKYGEGGLSFPDVLEKKSYYGYGVQNGDTFVIAPCDFVYNASSRIRCLSSNDNIEKGGEELLYIAALNFYNIKYFSEHYDETDLGKASLAKIVSDAGRALDEIAERIIENPSFRGRPIFTNEMEIQLSSISSKDDIKKILFKIAHKKRRGIERWFSRLAGVILSEEIPFQIESFVNNLPEEKGGSFFQNDMSKEEIINFYKEVISLVGEEGEPCSLQTGTGEKLGCIEYFSEEEKYSERQNAYYISLLSYYHKQNLSSNFNELVKRVKDHVTGSVRLLKENDDLLEENKELLEKKYSITINVSEARKRGYEIPELVVISEPSIFVRGVRYADSILDKFGEKSKNIYLFLSNLLREIGEKKDRETFRHNYYGMQNRSIHPCDFIYNDATKVKCYKERSTSPIDFEQHQDMFFISLLLHNFIGSARIPYSVVKFWTGREDSSKETLKKVISFTNDYLSLSIEKVRENKIIFQRLFRTTSSPDDQEIGEKIIEDWYRQRSKYALEQKNGEFSGEFYFYGLQFVDFIDIEAVRRNLDVSAVGNVSMYTILSDALRILGLMKEGGDSSSLPNIKNNYYGKSGLIHPCDFAYSENVKVDCIKDYRLVQDKGDIDKDAQVWYFYRLLSEYSFIVLGGDNKPSDKEAIIVNRSMSGGSSGTGKLIKIIELVNHHLKKTAEAVQTNRKVLAEFLHGISVDEITLEEIKEEFFAENRKEEEVFIPFVRFITADKVEGFFNIQGNRKNSLLYETGRERYKLLSKLLAKHGKATGNMTKPEEAYLRRFYGSSSGKEGIIHPCDFVYEQNVKINCDASFSGERAETQVKKYILLLSAYSLIPGKEYSIARDITDFGDLSGNDVSRILPTLIEAVNSHSEQTLFMLEGRRGVLGQYTRKYGEEISDLLRFNSLRKNEKIKVLDKLFLKELETAGVIQLRAVEFITLEQSTTLDEISFDITEEKTKVLLPSSGSSSIIGDYQKLSDYLKTRGLMGKEEFYSLNYYGSDHQQNNSKLLIHPCDFIYSKKDSIKCSPLRFDTNYGNKQLAFYISLLVDYYKTDNMRELQTLHSVSSGGALTDRLFKKLIGEVNKHVEKTVQFIKGSKTLLRDLQLISDSPSLDKEIEKRMLDYFITTHSLSFRVVQTFRIKKFKRKHPIIGTFISAEDEKNYKEISDLLRERGRRKTLGRIYRNYYGVENDGEIHPCDFIYSTDNRTEINCSSLRFDDNYRDEQTVYYVLLLSYYKKILTALDISPDKQLPQIISLVNGHFSKTIEMIKKNRGVWENNYELNLSDNFNINFEKKMLDRFKETSLNGSTVEEYIAVPGVELFDIEKKYSKLKKESINAYKVLSSVLREHGLKKSGLNSEDMYLINYYGTNGEIHPCDFIYSDDIRTSCDEELRFDEDYKEKQAFYHILLLSHYYDEKFSEIQGGELVSSVIRAANNHLEETIKMVGENEFLLKKYGIIDDISKEREIRKNLFSECFDEKACTVNIPGVLFIDLSDRKLPPVVKKEYRSLSAAMRNYGKKQQDGEVYSNYYGSERDGEIHPCNLVYDDANKFSCYLSSSEVTIDIENFFIVLLSYHGFEQKGSHEYEEGSLLATIRRSNEFLEQVVKTDDLTVRNRIQKKASTILGSLFSTDSFSSLKRYFVISDLLQEHNADSKNSADRPGRDHSSLPIVVFGGVAISEKRNRENTLYLNSNHLKKYIGGRRKDMLVEIKRDDHFTSSFFKKQSSEDVFQRDISTITSSKDDKRQRSEDKIFVSRSIKSILLPRDVRSSLEVRYSFNERFLSVFSFLSPLDYLSVGNKTGVGIDYFDFNRSFFRTSSWVTVNKGLEFKLGYTFGCKLDECSSRTGYFHNLFFGVGSEYFIAQRSRDNGKSMLVKNYDVPNFFESESTNLRTKYSEFLRSLSVKPFFGLSYSLLNNQRTDISIIIGSNLDYIDCSIDSSFCFKIDTSSFFIMGANSGGVKKIGHNSDSREELGDFTLSSINFVLEIGLISLDNNISLGFSLETMKLFDQNFSVVPDDFDFSIYFSVSF